MSHALRDLISSIPVTPLSKKAGWSHSTKAVLSALSEYVNYAQNGERVWPSLKSLQERSGYSERMIRYCLNWLDAVGWITVENRFNNTSVYTLHTGILEAAHAKARADIAARTAGARGDNYAPGDKNAGPAPVAAESVNPVASQRVTRERVVASKGIPVCTVDGDPGITVLPLDPFAEVDAGITGNTVDAEIPVCTDNTVDPGIPVADSTVTPRHVACMPPLPKNGPRNFASESFPGTARRFDGAEHRLRYLRLVRMLQVSGQICDSAGAEPRIE